VKAETGTTQSIDELKGQIDTMMIAWKTNTYPAAWRYMQQCASAVETQGFIANPWGRRRIFPVTQERSKLAGFKREAQNFPIQSTVADTCIIALHMLMQYRDRNQLHYRIVNQVHDAIMLEVPENEMDQAKEACQATMGSIYIPMPGQPLRLAIDMDVMTRWGEKE
jgi:DNA polymerase I-like protein with 3'-5' exonuclease and polymerase domains